MCVCIFFRCMHRCVYVGCECVCRGGLYIYVCVWTHIPLLTGDTCEVLMKSIIAILISENGSKDMSRQ